MCSDIAGRRFSDIIFDLFSNITFTAGFMIVTVVAIIAVLADIISPYPPLEFVAEPLLPPSELHPFGTDDLGRDLFSMTLHGSRVSLMVGITAAVISTLVGIAVGLTSGIVRGVLDMFTMRVIDFLLSLPYLAIALAILSFLKPNMMIIIMIIVVLSWIPTAKVVRAHTFSIMESLYVEAAKAMGAGRFYIAIKHILPNVIPITLSSLVLNVRDAILFEASLSFLGLGDPSSVSWGTILFFARRAGAFAANVWWYIVPPGFMIMLTVLGFTLMAIGLDEVLNPRLKKTQ